MGFPILVRCRLYIESGPRLDGCMSSLNVKKTKCMVFSLRKSYAVSDFILKGEGMEYILFIWTFYIVLKYGVLLSWRIWCLLFIAKGAVKLTSCPFRRVIFVIANIMFDVYLFRLSIILFWYEITSFRIVQIKCSDMKITSFWIVQIQCLLKTTVLHSTSSLVTCTKEWQISHSKNSEI